MALVVRDVGKVPHSCTSVEPEPWDAYSTGETRFVRSHASHMANSTIVRLSSNITLKLTKIVRNFPCAPSIYTYRTINSTTENQKKKKIK